MTKLPTVEFRTATFSGYVTGALDIRLTARRIISIPTQIGCRVGCTFCVSSKTPLVRNLKAGEMLRLIDNCLAAAPANGCPIELSFTGEGEAVLNWREAEKVCEALPAVSADFNAVRYCFSGIGADRLLGKLNAGSFPMRLQLSLHAARQGVRDLLVPKSLPLDDIKKALYTHAARFSAIELNVVLQDGVNDAPEDLAALAAWGDSEWPIILNPLLTDGFEQHAKAADQFDTVLRAAGRQVLRYARIGRGISRQRIYPLMTATKR